MGFEVKDGPSLDKALNGLGDAVEKMQGALTQYDERLNGWDGKFAELQSIVTDTQKQVEDSLRRHLPEKATQILIDTDLGTSLSWDAVHKASIPVRRKSGGGRFEFDAADRDDLVGKFHDASDRLYMLAGALKLIDQDGRIKSVQALRSTKFYQQVYAPIAKRVYEAMEKDGFSIGVSGSGSEWDPTSFSGRFWEKQRVPLQVESLIPSFVLPRSPFLFPVEVGDLTSYLVGEITTAPPILGSTSGYIPDGKGSTTITSSKTFTSKKHALMAFVSKEAEEDLIVPILPYMESKVIQAINIGKENSILNGDTNVVAHMDGDVTSATDVRKSFDGLRDYALNVATSGTKDAGAANINTDALWRDHIRGARKLMADAYKGNNANLALIVSGNTAIDIGSCESFRTAYAMGGMGTNKIGDSTGFSPDGLGAFVVSEYNRSDVSATGANVSGGSNLYTTAIQFYREAWLLGNERNIRLEVLRERFAEYDVDAVKVTWRGDLKAMLAGNHTVATININAS